MLGGGVVPDVELFEYDRCRSEAFGSGLLEVIGSARPNRADSVSLGVAAEVVVDEEEDEVDVDAAAATAAVAAAAPASSADCVILRRRNRPVRLARLLMRGTRRVIDEEIFSSERGVDGEEGNKAARIVAAGFDAFSINEGKLLRGLGSCGAGELSEDDMASRLGRVSGV